MKRHGIRARIVSSFLLIIILMGGLIALFGYWVIRRNVIDRAQNQLRFQLSTARSVYRYELECIQRTFEMLDCVKNPGKLKKGLDLDYLFVVEPGKRDSFANPTIQKAFDGNSSGGIRIMDSTELRHMSEELFERAAITLKSTPKARPSGKTQLSSAMALEYAAPIFNENGTVARVICGGRIINRDFALIDRMHHLVFEDKLYNAKPVGTVTIFEDDVRIATNVLDKDGAPAVGTRVSAIVYDKVLVKGEPWYSRAFVVTDWYLTAYEPIKDVNGSIVGILYVGALEAPFRDIIRSSLLFFLIIIGGAIVLAIVLTLVLSGGLTNPLTRLVKATASLANGDLSHRVPNNEKIRELHELAVSFNEMAHKLLERDANVRTANDELAVLNKRYLDLVGMVSHELKGILSSTMLNTFSVRDEYLGTLNEAQKKALESVARNLEYFDLTVKNFLNLSRIEKNELQLALSDVPIKEDVIDESVHAFAHQAHERGITIQNKAVPGMIVSADPFQLLVLLNNLIGNAVKYGSENGALVVTTGRSGSELSIEVYSDGLPISKADQKKLFKRFSRLDRAADGRRVRGTGLGLFLCREIAERHNGSIRCEPREQGNAFIVTLPVQHPEKINNTLSTTAVT